MSEALMQSILSQTESRIENAMGVKVKLYYKEIGVSEDAYEALFLKCCNALQVEAHQVKDRCRKKETVAMRQAIAFVLKANYPCITLSKLASLLNFGHHTTVIHNLQVAKGHLDSRDQLFMQYYAKLIPLLR